VIDSRGLRPSPARSRGTPPCHRPHDLSRIPRPLARRIDRLARRAHAFHRWAHHPLCARYGPEVVRLGRRTRVCRGCALTVLGAVTGLAAGLASPAAPGVAWLAAAALLAAAVPLAIPPLATPDAPAELDAAAGARRTPKLLTRFLPLAVAGGALAQALVAPTAAGIGAAALAAGATAWGTARYRRRGPDRAACRTCPEGPPGARCSGYAPLVRREHAMARLAGRWISAASAGRVAGRGAR